MSILSTLRYSSTELYGSYITWSNELISIIPEPSIEVDLDSNTKSLYIDTTFNYDTYKKYTTCLIYSPESFIHIYSIDSNKTISSNDEDSLYD